MLPAIPSQQQQITLQINFDPTRLAPPVHWDWTELLSMHGVGGIQLLQYNNRQQQAEDTPSSPDSLTAAELAALLYPNELTPPISPDPRDNPIFRVRVVPYAIGVRIANLDPDRRHFHFEFYPLRGTAEIWSALAWEHSLTRRLRLSAMAREFDPGRDLNQRLENLRQHLIQFIAATLHVPYNKAKEAAEGFISFFEQYEPFWAILNPPAELSAELKAVRELINSNPSAPSTSNE